jgi:hypothetical protein
MLSSEVEALEQALMQLSYKTPAIPDTSLPERRAEKSGRPWRWAWGAVPAMLAMLYIANPPGAARFLGALTRPRSAHEFLGVQTAWSLGEGYTLSFDIFEDINARDERRVANTRRFFSECQDWAREHGMTFSPSPLKPADIWVLPEPGEQYESEFKKDRKNVHLRTQDKELCASLAAALAVLPGVSVPIITEPVVEVVAPRHVIINRKTHDFPGKFSEDDLADLYAEIAGVRKVGSLFRNVKEVDHVRNGFLRDKEGNDTYSLGKSFKTDMDAEGNLVISSIPDELIANDNPGTYKTPRGLSQETLKLLQETSKPAPPRLPERDFDHRYLAEVHYWFVEPRDLLATGGATVKPEDATKFEATTNELQSRFDMWAANNPQLKRGNELGSRAWAGPEVAGANVVGFTLRLLTNDLSELDSVERELATVFGLPVRQERVMDYNNGGFVKNRGPGEIVRQSPAPLK